MPSGKHKHILTRYNLTADELSNMFGAKSSASFRNSSAYKRYMKAAELIAERVENTIIEKIGK